MAKKKKEEILDISKEAILNAVLGDLTKKYGSSIIRNTKESLDGRRYSKNCISTGSINLDRLFGVGGLPYGKILEVRGNPGSFKTGLLICMAKKAQQQGFFIVFSDNEHRFDPDRAEQLGLIIDDKSKFLLVTPENGEQSLSAIETIIRSINKVFIIIDSLSALLPEGDMKKAMDEGAGAMGSQARLLATGLKRLTGSIAKSNSILAFTNQYRTVSAGMFMFKGVSGGNAPKYFNSYIIEVLKWDKNKQLKDYEGNQIGQIIELDMVKSSSDYPGRTRSVPIHLGKGIWQELEVINLGLDLGIIEKATAIYSLPKISSGQNLVIELDENENPMVEIKIKGKDNVLKYLEENSEYMEKIVDIIRNIVGVRA